MIQTKDIVAIPKHPGVYIMKDRQGTVLYIGKAASLRTRVGSYFQKKAHDNRIERLIDKVEQIDYRLCESEAQALLLEASLIKEYQPFYNVELKDDKSFPYLIITQEEYPRIYVGRPKHLPNTRLIGPFPSPALLRQALKLVRSVIPFRSCKRLPPHPCLFYHVNKCPGVCRGNVRKDLYSRLVEEIVLLFSGEKERLLGDLRKRMRRYAQEQRFEDAKYLRDRITALQQLLFGSRNMVQQVAALQRALGIKDPLNRIEGFDISCLRGTAAVGSQVCFIEGIPAKNFYRRYAIKDVSLRDDVGMMREVLTRRLRRLREERRKTLMPRLLIVDGGIAHANMAKKLLESLRLYDMNVIGIAKKNEELWLPFTRKPIILEEGSPALILIQRIRDEAHRFARAYHVLRRTKAVFKEA